MRNGSESHLILLSIEERGNITWQYEFSQQVTAINDATNGRYISVGLENASVYVFSRSSDNPRQVFHIGSVPREIDMTMSGIRLGVIYGEGKGLGLFGFDSQTPIWNFTLVSEGQDMVVKGEGESILVFTDDQILKVTEGVLVSVTEVKPLVDYSAPVVSDWIFASTSGEIIAFKEDRGEAMWSSDLETGTSGIITDAGGNSVIFWAGNTLGVIQNEAVAGDSTLWAVFGFLLISEVLVFPVASWWKRIYETRREILYLLLAGAVSGVIVSAVFPDAEAIAWFGSEAVMAMSAILCALISLISWKVDAGVANVVVGFTMGIILTIPMALMAHFTLGVMGYQFADNAFYSIVKMMVTGLEMGIVGGIVGLLANRLLK